MLFLYGYGDHQDLHSFPTRRSSDLSKYREKLLSASVGQPINGAEPMVWQGERSEEHTSELQSRQYLVCRLLLEKKNHATPRARAPPRCAAPTLTARSHAAAHARTTS